MNDRIKCTQEKEENPMQGERESRLIRLAHAGLFDDMVWVYGNMETGMA